MMSCGCGSKPAIINLVSGDELPKLVVQIKNNTSSQVVDLSGSGITVKFRFREQGSSTTLFEETMVKIGTGSTGGASLTWPAGKLDVEAGRYEGEVSITSGSNVQTIFDLILFNVRKRFSAPA